MTAGRLNNFVVGLLLSTLLVLAMATASKAAPPANDNFADAQTLSGVPASVDGNNSEATTEPGETNAWGGSAAGQTVWYSWTAPADGPVAITTFGSRFDTILGVYTGSGVDGLSPIGVNDDELGSEGLRTSTVNFEAAAGTTYRIMIDGYNESAGQFQLSIAIPGTVTGRMTDSSNAGLDGVCVSLQSQSDSHRYRTLSGADGTFTITGVFPGEYAVHFAPAIFGCNSNFISEYFNEQATYPGADRIVVPAGGNRPGVDATLSAGGEISGAVTDDQNDPLPNICVNTYDSAGDPRGGASYTDADGEFTVAGLTAGNYRVRFSDCGGHDVSSEYFDDATTLASATPIPVVANETSGISASLDRTSSISGMLTDANDEPAEGACAIAFDLSHQY
ncbi:MAG: carboxypeptidase-like regulatory domain-containing protein, partial [Actinomycetota bacterium]|nr:carboxypeptidase-like regulatory domain-containing protein [Actinomycetota bacterium]